MFYSNLEREELDNAASFVGLEIAKSIEDAELIFIDLEKYIFKDYPQLSFSNHNFSLKELTNRLDHLIKMISDDGKKRRVYLFAPMIDVRSQVDDNLFWWSYYNHKFTASKGKDTEAMNKWHEFETANDINKIAAFKALRETNLGFYLEIIKKHLHFTEVIFKGIDDDIKKQFEFGLDIAEEQYLIKMIEEHQAYEVCHILESFNATPLLNFVRVRFAEKNHKKVKVHIISNAERTDSKLVEAYKRTFLFMDLEETDLKNSNVVVLFNDLDLMSALPFIDTENPIFVVDLSADSSPNFGYILLKDEGFDQIFSYVKKRPQESPISAFVRGLSQGLLSCKKQRVFGEQIAINYMDDYFKPLAKSHGKTLKEFTGPINLLVEKLEFQLAEQEKADQAWEKATDAKE